MKLGILILAVAASACAPKYVIQPQPANAIQPINLFGKAVVGISPDGSKVVWYMDPADVVRYLLRGMNAKANFDEAALAAELKRANESAAQAERCRTEVKTLLTERAAKP